MRSTIILCLLMLFTFPLAAQDDTHAVRVIATDGAALFASYTPAPNDDAPAVLLLHQLYTTRASWEAVTAMLHEAGYAVLAPDVRGYGETGGPINWQHAQEDTLVWLDWLAAQPGVRADTVWTVGSSMGANLAVIGCADFESCAGSVAVSPGRNYFGYTPLAPALDALSERDTPVWFITSERDGYPALAARQLAPDYPNVMVEWLPGNAHGIDLLDEATVAEVIGWLASG